MAGIERAGFNRQEIDGLIPINSNFADLSLARIGALVAKIPVVSDLRKAQKEFRLATALYARWSKNASYSDKDSNGKGAIAQIGGHVQKATLYYVKFLGLEPSEFAEHATVDPTRPLCFQDAAGSKGARQELPDLLREFGRCLALVPFSSFRASQSARVYHAIFQAEKPELCKRSRDLHRSALLGEADRFMGLAPSSVWTGERNMRLLHAACLSRNAAAFCEFSEQVLECKRKEVLSLLPLGNNRFLIRVLKEMLQLSEGSSKGLEELFLKCGDAIKVNGWEWEAGSETLMALQHFAHASWAYSWAGERGFAARQDLHRSMLDYLSRPGISGMWERALREDAEGLIFVQHIAETLGRLPNAQIADAGSANPSLKVEEQAQVFCVGGSASGAALELDIREANLNDLEAISRVHAEGCRSMLVRSVITMPRTELVGEPAYWDSQLKNSAVTMLVAESNGAVVGFVCFGAALDEDKDPRETAEIYDIFVLPNLHRRAVGSGLMLRAESLIRKRGYHEIVAWSISSNDQAHDFFCKHGYALDGSRAVRTSVIMNVGDDSQASLALELQRRAKKNKG